MKIHQRIEAFSKLGNWIETQLELFRNFPNEETEFSSVLQLAKAHNPWFSMENLRFALSHHVKLLNTQALTAWTDKYPQPYFQTSDLKVGVIMAGNIPLVGFHDLLCVLISGKKILIKTSSSDSILIPFLIKKLIDIEPLFAPYIQIESHILKDYDAIIATGSNNSARYFEQYFSKVPHIIRHNRNSLAVINGNETSDDLHKLGQDIFYYFGLGCRNVSKVYVPQNYSFNHFFESIQNFDYVSQHTKYFNNYEYNKALFLINKVAHLDNGFLLLKESESIASPVGILNYEFYSDIEVLKNAIISHSNQIQCLLSQKSLGLNELKFGNSQIPSLDEYADNVDVMLFLGQLSK
jgi:hypothetical protein